METIDNKLMQRPEIGSEIGKLLIPSISLDYPVIHGEDDDELSKGVEYYAGSTLPGEGGNVVLYGHRDTMFRNLGKVKIGDVISVKTTYGTYNYKASNIRIVNEVDRTVVVRSSKEMLTLVALQLSLFTKMKQLNSDFYISIFQKNNLYSYTKQSTENKLLNLGRVVNLPKEIFQGLITDEWVKQEIDNSTKQTIEYMTYKAG